MGGTQRIALGREHPLVTIIHVNRQFIALNAKDGKRRPVYVVREGRKVTYAREVYVLGPCRFVDAEKPLSCGAKAWCETDSVVCVLDGMTFAEARSPLTNNSH